jgi:hypothetical protein
MTDVIDKLVPKRVMSAKYCFLSLQKWTLEREGKGGRERGKERNITFSLSGIPDNALGSREDSMFWMIVDAAATPQTVPMDRNR